MSTEKLEASKKDGPHHQLNLLAGNWEGITRTWFEPGILADESPMAGVIKPVLNGSFMIHEYKGSLGGKAFEGIAIYGSQLSNGVFQCAWIDSFHMGTTIMLSEGGKNEKGFSVLGTYGGPGIEKPWGWRTEIQLTSNDELVITAFNITPEGEEAKAVETIYKRKQ